AADATRGERLERHARGGLVTAGSVEQTNHALSDELVHFHLRREPAHEADSHLLHETKVVDDQSITFPMSGVGELHGWGLRGGPCRRGAGRPRRRGPGRDTAGPTRGTPRAA